MSISNSYEEIKKIVFKDREGGEKEEDEDEGDDKENKKTTSILKKILSKFIKKNK